MYTRCELLLLCVWILNDRSLDRYILLDTPGQIEVFTWSASGSIITETLVSYVQ